jgi:hypothetical protein
VAGNNAIYETTELVSKILDEVIEEPLLGKANRCLINGY